MSEELYTTLSRIFFAGLALAGLVLLYFALKSGNYLDLIFVALLIIPSACYFYWDILLSVPKEETEHQRIIRKLRESYGQDVATKEVPVKTELSLEYLRAKIQKYVEAYLYLFPSMKAPRVDIGDVFPVVGLARAYASNDSLIVIDKDYLLNECKGDVTDPRLHRTIKHEMVHCWIYFKKLSDDDIHGKVFQDFFGSIEDEPIPKITLGDDPLGIL